MRPGDKPVNDEGLVYPYGENGILFTTEYIILNEKLHPSQNYEGLAKRAISNYQVNGDFEFSEEEGLSHDNKTAIVSLSKRYNLGHEKKFFWKHWKQHLHPRDLIYYAILKGGLASLIGYFFLPLLSLIMVISCFEKTKNIDGAEVVSTDGILLAWVRINTINLKMTNKICLYVLSKNNICKSWQDAFKIYFREPDHILLQFPKETYDK